MISTETIRKITIQAQGKDSVDALAASMAKLGQSQAALTQSAGAAATVTDLATKRQLSAAEAYRRQTLAVVDGARAQDQFARSVKVADSALQQGVITAADHAQRIEALRQKYLGAGQASQGFGAALSGASTVLAAFGVSLSAAGLVQFGRNVFESSAQLVDQANQLGISVNALQAYRNALKDNGAQADDAGVLISKLSQTLGSAETGSAQARAEFTKLGVNWKDLAASANPVESSVQAVTAAILAIPDPAQRAAAELQFFGRSGREAGASLADLGSNLDSLVQKYKDQGRLLDSELAQKAKAASDQMTQAFQRLQVEAAGPVVFLTDKLTLLLDAIVNIQRFGHIDLSHGFLNGAISVASMGLVSTGGSSPEADPLHPANRSPLVPIHGGGGNTYSSDNFDQYLAKTQQAAQLAGLSANERAREGAAIEAANALLKDGITATGKVYDYSAGVVQNYKQALEVLGPTRAAEIQRAASLAQSAQDIAAIQAWQKTQIEFANKLREMEQRNADENQKAIENGGALLIQQNKKEMEAYAANLAAGDAYTQTLTEQVALAGLSAEQREREAAVLEAMRLTNGTINADTVRGLVAARQEAEKWRHVVEDIQGNFQSFFDDVLEHGTLNFGKLFRAIEGQFAQMLAQMAAQALVQPIIVPMVQSVFGGSSGGLAGTLFGGGGFPTTSDGPGTGGLAGNLGGLGSIFSGGINSLGGSLGFATSTTIPGFSLAGQSFAPATFTTPGSLFGSASLGGVLGGAGIGGLAGSLVFGNKADAGIGGAIGGAIGSIFGPLGSLAGGLIGSGLGSMTGSSNQSSVASLTNGGRSYALSQQGSQQNTGLVGQAAQAINQAVNALNQAGVTLSNDISGIGIGTDKDYIYYANGTKQKLGSKADPSDMINQVLNHLLGSAAASDSGIAGVIGSYKGQGGITSSNLSQFLSDIGFANSLKDMGVTVKQLTQSEQQIKAINDQFQTTIDHAKQLGLDTATIIAARDAADRQVYQTALDALDALRPANDNADAWTNALATIAAAEKEATAAANALGFSLDDVSTSAAAAYGAVSGAFNSQVADAILKITNPALSDYNALLATQTQRLKDAAAIGADLNQVYQLNSLEQQQLRDRQQQLLDQQRQEDLNNALSGLGKNVSALSTQANEAARAAQTAAQAWGGANDAIVKASSALLISDQSLSPLAQYGAARSQFDALRAAAFGGDATAAGNIASFAGTFLQKSFAYNASTSAYGGDLGYVQQTLSGLADFTASQRNVFQSQVDAYAKMVTLLDQINQAIQDQTVKTQDAFDGLAHERGPGRRSPRHDRAGEFRDQQRRRRT
jgi:hypothetical protein